MTQTKLSPAPAATGNGAEELTKSTRKRSTRPTKIQRVFQALASGRSYNRFEAARELHDTCLHSTVAAIQQRYGVQVFRRYETIRGFQGAPTPVCRYRLVGPELIKARMRLAAELVALGIYPDTRTALGAFEAP